MGAQRIRQVSGLVLLVVAAGLLAAGSAGTWVSENYALPAPRLGGGGLSASAQTFTLGGLHLGAGQWVLAAAMVLAIVTAGAAAFAGRHPGVLALAAVPATMAGAALGYWSKALSESGGATTTSVAVSWVGLALIIPAVTLAASAPGRARWQLAAGILVVAVVALVVGHNVGHPNPADRQFLRPPAGPRPSL